LRGVPGAGGAPAPRRARVRLRPGVHSRRRCPGSYDGGVGRRREGRDQPSRPGGESIAGVASEMTSTVGGVASKQRTAALSVVSNSALILLKVIAGTTTGSVAVLTEAVHSSIDLIASIVAFISVRKAGEPADETHRYGHEKIENLSAAIEGMLILVGSVAIAFEAIRRLINGGRLHTVGLGIAVVALSIVVNVIVSGVIGRKARETSS